MQIPTIKTSMISRLFNRTKDLLFIGPFQWYWRNKLNGKLMVYLYHRIGELGEYPYLDKGNSPIISQREFKKDLLFLKKQGAKFIRFCDINKSMFDTESFYVIISIDDGFASNYQAGIDVLDELAIPSTVFQCSKMTTSNTLIWEHQLYWLYYAEYSDKFRRFIYAEKLGWPDSCNDIRETIEPQNILQLIGKFLQINKRAISLMKDQAKALYPSVEQLLRAERLGHEIASHGASHLKRTNISNNKFKKELTLSQKDLEGALGRKPVSFSYPFNSYQKGDNKLCSEFYNFVATVDGGVIEGNFDAFSLPRNTWPGAARNSLRRRRWLLTGSI